MLRHLNGAAAFEWGSGGVWRLRGARTPKPSVLAERKERLSEAASEGDSEREQGITGTTHLNVRIRVQITGMLGRERKAHTAARAACSSSAHRSESVPRGASRALELNFCCSATTCERYMKVKTVNWGQRHLNGAAAVCGG